MPFAQFLKKSLIDFVTYFLQSEKNIHEEFAIRNFTGISGKNPSF